MTTQTADEALSYRIEWLGPEAGRFFRTLENNLYMLRSKWGVYEGMFGTNPERVDLLNSVSGKTAYFIERSLRESIILSICRMTDPEKGMKGEKNITIQRLSSYLKNGTDYELNELVKAALEKAKFAKAARDKTLAHSDDKVSTGSLSVSMGSRKDQREAIDAIADCIKHFARVEMGVDLRTHPVEAAGGDEVELLQTVYLGKHELERAENERIRAAKELGWKVASEFSTLPDWLIFRPPHNFED